MQNNQEKPPFFKTWGYVYALVAGTLAALMVLFYLLTKYFE